MHKTLTLVIPSYNMEAYLPRCIDSLGIDSLKEVVLPDAGTLGDRLEVLIVNDGSKDRTSEIAHDFESRYPQIVRAIDKPNGHYGSCVNRGLAEAQGTFIKILDADDSFDTTNFEGFLKFLVDTCEAETETDLILSDFQSVGLDGELKSTLSSFSMLPHDCQFDANVIRDTSPSEWFMPALTYRVDRLRQMAYVQSEGMLYTDMEWDVLPFAVIRKIRYIPVRLYLYYVGREGQSMSTEVWLQNFSHRSNLWVNIARKYACIGNFVGLANKDVVERKVFLGVKNVYVSCLIKLDIRSVKTILNEFDNELLSANALIYRMMDNVTIPSKKGFHFIRFWRNHRRWTTVLCLQMRLYARLARVATALIG